VCEEHDIYVKLRYMLPLQPEALTKADSDVAHRFHADSCVELAYSGIVLKET
jgi:hypothetical protein